MKRAAALPRYRNMQPFARPDGIVSAEIDPESGEIATPACPESRDEVFIAGTEPVESCSLHREDLLDRIPPVSWLSRVFGGGDDEDDDKEKEKAEEPKKEDRPEEKKKKRGFFSRIFGIGE
jgi:membrane carboxypeptidase/penicillin-binding protein